MLDKAVDQLDQRDIESLLTNKVAESRNIEYKQKLPGATDADKKELLADVTSFANSSGGYLIFGIIEDGGVPTEILGLPDPDLDRSILRLESIIRDGAAPRVLGIQVKRVGQFTEGPVLIVHVPQSWCAPHMVIFQAMSRFYVRNSAGKHPMDVTEIRAAFEYSSALPQRVKQFRDQRLGEIVSGNTPVVLADAPRMVLHMIPFSATAQMATLDLELAAKHGDMLNPISGGGLGRFNLDGYVVPSDSPNDEPTSRGYCQVFRNGAIESVDAFRLRARTDERVLSCQRIEQLVMTACDGYRRLIKSVCLPLPYVVMLSLLRVKGYRLFEESRFVRYETTCIDRDTVLLPDVLIVNSEDPIDLILRPIFDAMWNAAGWPRSLSYGENGRWKQ